MNATWVTVSVAVIVILSGCPALGDGGTGTETPTRPPPDHHEIAFSAVASDDQFEATITITNDGETVAERTVESATTGTYATVATLDDPGPYTVTVNTTIPVGKNGTLSDRFEIDGDSGTATVVMTDLRGVRAETLSLPRRDIEDPIGVRPLWNGSIMFGVNVSVHVWYQGEQIGSDTVELDEGAGYADRAAQFPAVDLNRTGVYHVAARVPMSGAHPEAGDWTNETLVVSDPDTTIILGTTYVRSSVKSVQTENATDWP